LHQRLLACETAEWVWFEDRLTYDNARLCEALIITGKRWAEMTGRRPGCGWLIELQTAPAGYFRPVGSHGFLLVSRAAPMPFDQQPIEACATVAACLAAMPVDASRPWLAEAHKAFAWFTGANDLGLSLIDPLDGSCRDGLHPDRANEPRRWNRCLSAGPCRHGTGKLAHRPIQPAPDMPAPSPPSNLLS
jgi:hypothetical protein